MLPLACVLILLHYIIAGPLGCILGHNYSLDSVLTDWKSDLNYSLFLKVLAMPLHEVLETLWQSSCVRSFPHDKNVVLLHHLLACCLELSVSNPADTLES